VSNSEGNGNGVLVVKNWSVVLALVSWAVFCVGAFFTLKAQTDENTRRLLELEQRPAVTLMQYQDGQKVLEQRLDRIERKLDNADSLQRRH
jgi:hypothetical protein